MQPLCTSPSQTDSHWSREHFERDARREKREVEAIERELVAEFERRAQCARQEDRELRREERELRRDERELRRDEREQATLERELVRDVAVQVADTTLIAAEAQRSKREERQEERQIESGLAAAKAGERELARDAANFESQYLRKEAGI
jgi:hypothetical protein